MTEPTEDDFLNSLGYGFPENSYQLGEFKKAFSSYEFKGRVAAIDPEKILQSLSSKSVVTRIDYHKRTVLAAEIVHRLHQEWSMGHVKLQKLLYLCQKIGNMPLHANFLKQAMGPYDPVMMRSLDKQFKIKKWFDFKHDGKPKYQPLENIGGHKKWFGVYYAEHLDKIDYLIETFRQTKTDETELVATIYACWLSIQENKEELSDSLLIQRVYEWSSHKQKFSEDKIIQTILWMKKEGIRPK